MRRVQQRVLLAFLTASMPLVGVLPLYGRKNLDNPDKIGHRNVAHHCIISPEKEAEIGKQFAARYEQTVKIIRDPEVQRYVTQVAENVARNSDWKGPVTVKVVNSPEANSLSLPGGFIYLTSGLLLNAENEDEIAGAIAHQLAHAAARHWASEMTKATILQFSMVPLLFIPSDSPQLACLEFLPCGRDSVTVSLAFRKFHRKDELEADYLGLQYMYKAGYDPNGFVHLLRRVARMQPASARLSDSFQDMPSFLERIAKAEEEIRRILPEPRTPTKPSPDFTVMKTRL